MDKHGNDKRKGILREKSFNLALRIVKLYKFLVETHKEFVMSKQILKSGTSPAAMVREAEYAESGKDFVHKLQIGQKELSETMFWLELLYESEYLDENQFESIHNDATEVMRILTKSILTQKKEPKIRITLNTNP